MTQPPKSYPPEYKQQIVDLYRTGNYLIQELGYKYDIPISILLDWVKELSYHIVLEKETVTVEAYKELEEKLRLETSEKAKLIEAFSIFIKDIQKF
jgi:transposase-like protein